MSNVTLSFFFLMQFENNALVLSRFWFSQHQKMLLISQKLVLIENEAAEPCVTMWKRFTPTLATVWHKRFWQHIYLIKNKNCDPSLRSAITQKRDVSNPMFLYFSQSLPFFLSVAPSLSQWSGCRESAKLRGLRGLVGRLGGGGVWVRGWRGSKIWVGHVGCVGL